MFPDRQRAGVAPTNGVIELLGRSAQAGLGREPEERRPRGVLLEGGRLASERRSQIDDRVTDLDQ